MHIQDPIFVNGFSRGGTTILMNLLASHPDIVTVGEIHQVFKGSNVLDSALMIARKAVFRDAPLILTSRQDLFSPRNWRPRERVSGLCQALIDAALLDAKTNSNHPYLNLQKDSKTRYARHEIQASRLLGKNLDGMVHTTEIFQEMYPQAQFINLVRNGHAVCEGHLRRGRSPENTGRLYQDVATRMLNDCELRANHQLVRFEDLLADPWRVTQNIWIRLGLNPFTCHEVRWQRRKRVQLDGQHRVEAGREWEIVWCSPDDLGRQIDAGIDQRQIQSLDPQAAAAFDGVAGSVMERLGYDRSTNVAS